MSAPKKHSIDQMIEHMTADRHNNTDGQYVPLGFTPPPTPATVPHAWPDYSAQYLRQGMSHLSDLHYGVDPSHLIKQPDIHPSYYYAAHQQMMADSHLLDSGLVNYASTNPNQSYHMMPEGQPEVTHPLGGFIPYHPANLEQRDYGLFGNPPSDMHPSRPIQQQYQPNVSNQAQLIENLVGNWVPNQTGTYSPFGCVDVGSKPMTNQQTTQTADMDSERGVGRGYQRGAKQRAVAEVRPMRPSYSDVLTKSPPVPVVATTKSATPRCDPGKAGKTPATKSGTKKNKGGTLKRQHSSGSDEHNGINKLELLLQLGNAANTRKGECEQKSEGEEQRMPRKWVSLDGLDSSETMAMESEGFQAEEVRAGGGAKKLGKRNQQDNWDTSNTLNNHKPSNGTGTKGSVGSGSKRPIQINNNLGSTWAHNAGAQLGALGSSGPQQQGEKNMAKKNCKTCAEEKKGNGGGAKTDGKRTGSGRSSSLSGSAATAAKRGGGQQRSKRREHNSPLSVLCRPARQHLNRWTAWVMQAVAWFLHLLSDVLGMSCKLSIHLFGHTVEWLNGVTVSALRRVSCVMARARVGERLTRLWRWGRGAAKPVAGADDDGETRTQGGYKEGPPGGLEYNMSLPATGDEAMKRLLACKGKDPYSILGVAPHCSDEDVKRYYKRQAFLVHPDKNNQPGAEEAFKILVHAFELIGEPERRKAYERRVAETQQVEQAWSELSDLLHQLHQKMEYAANTIRCTNCGKRHRRTLVQRPCYAARNCAQCKIHHAAREGDIWAESSVLGFLWHYFACMDGAVYDITEWAACQAENLKHLRANTHNVQYRIVLGKQAGGGKPGKSGAGRGAPDAAAQGEPDLEDFLNNLYSQSGAAASAPGGGASTEGGAKTDAVRSRKKTKPRKK